MFNDLPSPGLLHFIVEETGPLPPCKSDCELACEVRKKAFDCLLCEDFCCRVPKAINNGSLGSEEYESTSDVIKMLRELIKWTYDICDRENSTHLVSHYPRPCVQSYNYRCCDERIGFRGW